MEIEQIKDWYKEALVNHGPTPKGMRFFPPESQKVMFQQVLNTINKYGGKGKSILDVGCGMGDLYFELPEGMDYTGIDIVPEYVEIAKKKLPPTTTIILGDVLTDLPLGTTYDIVIACGTFSNYSLEQVKKYLTHLWALTNQVIVVIFIQESEVTVKSLQKISETLGCKKNDFDCGYWYRCATIRMWK